MLCKYAIVVVCSVMNILWEKANTCATITLITEIFVTSDHWQAAERERERETNSHPGLTERSCNNIAIHVASRTNEVYISVMHGQTLS